MHKHRYMGLLSILVLLCFGSVTASAAVWACTCDEMQACAHCDVADVTPELTGAHAGHPSSHCGTPAPGATCHLKGGQESSGRLALPSVSTPRMIQPPGIAVTGFAPPNTILSATTRCMAAALPLPKMSAPLYLQHATLIC